MEKPKSVKKPNTKISPSRAYELADSLMEASKRRIQHTPGSGSSINQLRSKAYDRDKSIRLKTRADQAVEKAGGVKADSRLGDRYNRRWDSNASVDNKAVGRDMPLPESSKLFDA
jgi:hypothetical protein